MDFKIENKKLLPEKPINSGHGIFLFQAISFGSQRAH
jgi:hypothetical protein